MAFVAQNYTEAPRLIKLADYDITTYNKPKAIEHKQDTDNSENELSDDNNGQYVKLICLSSNNNDTV